MRHPFIILVVEDNKGDVLMITEAFEDANLECQHAVVNNGKAALDYLFKKASFESVETPNLILLDLNIPKYNGLEVLKVLKNNEDLKAIPVVIFTTSSSANDVNACYQNHANCYITKPQDALGFMNAVTKIEEFWTKYANLSNFSKS